MTTPVSSSSDHPLYLYEGDVYYTVSKGSRSRSDQDLSLVKLGRDQNVLNAFLDSKKCIDSKEFGTNFEIEFTKSDTEKAWRGLKGTLSYARLEDGETMEFLPRLKFNALLEGIPKTLENLTALSDLIGRIREPGSVTRDGLINILHTALGIRPSCASVPRGVVAEFAKRFSHLKAVDLGGDSDFSFVAINENPLPEFDPRKYLKIEDYLDFESLYLAMEKERNAAIVHRFRSYLLGYGPCSREFESGQRHLNSELKRVSVFTDEHYIQRGQVLCKGEGTQEDWLKKGKEEEELDLPVVAMGGLGFISGPVPDKTEYFENRYSAEKAVADFFGI